METKLEFRRAIVWITTVNVIIPQKDLEILVEKQCVAYYSFSKPGSVWFAESLKDENGHTILFKNHQEALNFARTYFDYLN